MTREEAIKKIKKVIEESVIFEDELEAFDMAIKALSSSEKPNKWIGAEVLDKIRAEIDQYLFQNEFGSAYRKEVSQIIDKYKAESEVQE